MYNDINNQPIMINQQGQYINPSDDERFFFAPFLLGGLAGGALGYGIASSNQNYYPVYPMYPYPTNNYYYY